MEYREKSPQELTALLAELKNNYAAVKAKKLNLDMSRGKPDPQQVLLSKPVLDMVNSETSLIAEDGTDCGNYGGFGGIPEAKRLISAILDLPSEEIFIGGGSSLNLMHDVTTFCWLYPLPGGELPWCKQGPVKFLCPSPGYDRHFAVSQHLGLELVPVPMTATGPDMDVVEALVRDDASIKGMWCIPKYSNPTGVTYSDDTVRRLANLSPAAPDFRIFWDNAYAIHELYADRADTLLNIMTELKKTGKENMIFEFCSFAKITFGSACIAAVGAAPDNMAFVHKHMFYQLISNDKLNQLRHARYFKNLDGLRAHMAKHAALVRPKFEAVEEIFHRELSGLGIAAWTKPLGGYFVSFDTLDGCAKRVYALCKEAGVVLTPPGATFPYGNDPHDKNLRIAPSFPALEELRAASELFCLSVKLASVEKLLAQ